MAATIQRREVACDPEESSLPSCLEDTYFIDTPCCDTRLPRVKGPLLPAHCYNTSPIAPPKGPECMLPQKKPEMSYPVPRKGPAPKAIAKPNFEDPDLYSESFGF